MPYEREEPRRRGLTPLESELRAQPLEVPRRRSPLAPLLEWRRRRRPPATFAGALGLALVRLGLAVAVCAVVALLVAGWLDRATAIGFYLVGAAVLAMAFLFSAADVESMQYYDRGEREYRVRASLIWVVVGAIVLAIGAVLELT